MPPTKPTSRSVCSILTILLLLGLYVSTIASDPVIDDDDDLQGFEELLKLDEETEEEHGAELKSSEAQVLSKAQRIVLELSNDNTKRVIDDNEFVLVLGYAPWCARSAELMPQFAEAANSLKETGSSVLLAKLDAERYPKAASLLEIKGFPTLLLFVNGSSQTYTGGFSADEIVIWVRKKTGVPTIRLSSLSEAEEFLKKHKMFVIGLLEKFEGPDYTEFLAAAAADNEIQFAEATDSVVANVLFPDIKPKYPFLGLVKSEPERYVSFEDAFKMEKIMQFLGYNKFPLVTKLTELNSVKVYSSPIKLQVFIFANADDFKNLLVFFQDVARKFKSQIMFLYVDIAEENLAKPFLTLFGLEDSEGTVVTAFDHRISSKYLLESDVGPSPLESLQEFCSGLISGTLPPYFKSQSIPNNEKNAVLTVVGRTFDDLVLSSPKSILLEVHTPWCANCETTSKQIEKLAIHFKALGNLTFARIDASSNEHPKLEINDYPTLLFYPSGDKSNPIKLSNKSSLKEMAAFINKHIRDAEEKRKPTHDEATKDEL